MKYRSYEKKLPQRSSEPHPVWRGIGCIIMVIIPVVSFALSVLTIDAAIQNGIEIPRSISGYPAIYPLLYRIPGLVGLLNWFHNQYNLYAYLLMALFYIIVLGAILALAYAIMYRISAPPRYTGVDAPPLNVKVKRYKR